MEEGGQLQSSELVYVVVGGSSGGGMITLHSRTVTAQAEAEL